jgi:hypothetical protein
MLKLTVTPLTPTMDRLLLELVPTRPTVATPGPWTREEQDAHWNALCETVGAPRPARPAQQNAA